MNECMKATLMCANICIYIFAQSLGDKSRNEWWVCKMEKH